MDNPAPIDDVRVDHVIAQNGLRSRVVPAPAGLRLQRRATRALEATGSRRPTGSHPTGSLPHPSRLRVAPSLLQQQ